jgi:hypothetical protein
MLSALSLIDGIAPGAPGTRKSSPAISPITNERNKVYLTRSACVPRHLPTFPTTSCAAVTPGMEELMLFGDWFKIGANRILGACSSVSPAALLATSLTDLLAIHSGLIIKATRHCIPGPFNHPVLLLPPAKWVLGSRIYQTPLEIRYKKAFK